MSETRVRRVRRGAMVGGAVGSLLMAGVMGWLYSAGGSVLVALLAVGFLVLAMWYWWQS